MPNGRVSRVKSQGYKGKGKKSRIEKMLRAEKITNNTI